MSHQGGYSSDLLIDDKAIVGTIIIGSAATAAFAYFYFSSQSTNTKCSIVPGLINIGNTCYSNALLQSLASCPSVSAWLNTIDVDATSMRGGFIDSLKSILQDLNTFDTGKTLTAEPIVAALNSHGWNVRIGVEHDLFELFNVFVATWDDELKLGRRKLLLGSLGDCTFQPQMPTNLTKYRQLLSFETCANRARLEAHLRAPCVGMTETLFRCCNTNCDFRTHKYETFTTLTLSIPHNVGMEVSIEQLLKRNFCSEIIRDAICDQCKKTGRHQAGFLRKHGIVKLPQTLLIRIERVGILPSGHLKLIEHVTFGECLSLQEVCFRKNNKLNQIAYEESEKRWQLPDGTSRVLGGAEETKNLQPNLRTVPPSPSSVISPVSIINGGSFVSEKREVQKYLYQIRAVTEHRGGPFGGHFVTYRRAPSPNHHSWVLTNDDQVTRVPYYEVAKCQAYMMFYERVKPNRWYDRAAL